MDSKLITNDDFHVTRAYGKVINARARTHAPQDIHALLITHRNGKTFAPDAYCRSNLTGTIIEGLTRNDVTCKACIKGIERCDKSKTARRWE